MENFSKYQTDNGGKLKSFLIDTYNLLNIRGSINNYSKVPFFDEKSEDSQTHTKFSQLLDHGDSCEIICQINEDNLSQYEVEENSENCNVDLSRNYHSDDCKIDTIKNDSQGNSCENSNYNKENSKKHYKHFISGALAGAVSRSLTAPLERLKILYQVNYRCSKIKPPSIIKGLKEVYVSDGVTGLFRGNLINVTKATPETAIRLYVFEKVKFYLKAIHGEKLSTDKLFISGAIAGITASFSIFPLDVIKTRLSAAPSGTYNGILDTMHKLYKEGGVRIFYKGVEASLCSAMPNSGLNLCCYELLKRLFSGSYENDNSKYLSTPTLMLTGGLSAMISSSLLYPLQTIQSRIIMQGLSKSDMHMIRFNAPFFYIGDNLIIKKKQTMKQVMKSTFQKEGIRGFFKGYVPGISKIIIGNAISFGSYEKFKSLLKF
jgi:solute carrier family 25 phosphate transporter 23/24/25/41